jgi:hypothetical protein
MIALPFTAREFFDLFGDYNRAVWPAASALFGIAAVILVQVMQRRHPRLVLTLLGLMWVWMGLVYHLVFFARINPAAPVFATLFLLQAAILWWCAGQPVARSAGLGGTLGTRIGKSLVAYGLVGYPLVGYLVGHRFPETPMFGTPCPTTIFTMGMLLWYPWQLRWWVMVIPLLWSVIGTSAATQLSVPQDYGLTIAAIVTLLVLARRPIVVAGRHSRPTPSASATRLM